jgi:glucosamine-6-phosphate deaminase
MPQATDSLSIFVYPDAGAASRAAGERLAAWLTAPGVRSLVAAAGNSPLELYRYVAERRVQLPDLHVFALDEYVGVPPHDSRTCANLLRRTVADAWGIPSDRFHAVSGRPHEAPVSIREHEGRIALLGGPDVTVLGLGPNGHLGFNEPGSAPGSTGRVVDLEQTSVEANARWFGGEYAPTRGVTLGLRDILGARHVLLVAFGPNKADAVYDAVMGPLHPKCPASWLRRHGDVEFHLDTFAAARLPANLCRRRDDGT